MGKRGGQAESRPQAEINALIVETCRAGKIVARLKGGDPCVYGRATQEMDALHAAGCRFEIVPGVTSLLAGPASVGIPITDRDVGTTFVVASGHDAAALDYKSLAGSDTVVLLMATRTLEAVTDGLMAGGKPADTPVAIIKWATLPQQRVFSGTLGTIAHDLANERLSPSVVVVGAVAGFLHRYQTPGIVAA